MIMNKSKGRPKHTKPIEELSFTTFQQDITIFKNSLIDSLDDEDNDDEKGKEAIQKFLQLELWKQNIFIIYLLNKKKFTFKALAELLQVEKAELMRTIKSIKNDLKI